MKTLRSQKGSSLLEGLISIAIFSFGVLGTMSFQATMLAQSTQTSYRLAASMLVNSLSGAAESDPKNFACYTTDDTTYKTTVIAAAAAAGNPMDCTSATDYVASWKEQVATLKGASTVPPTSIINADGDLVITVGWKLPQELNKEKVTGEAQHMVTATLHPLVLGS